MKALALPEVWEQARTLYLAGSSAAAIAAKLGLTTNSVHVRASRQGWKATRRTGQIVNACLSGEAPGKVAELAVMVQAHGVNELQRRGLEMLETLAQDAKETINRLRTHRPGTVEEEEIRERTIKNVVVRVQQCCGLTDAGAGAGWLVVGRISAAAKAHQGEAQRLPEPLPSPAIIEVSTSAPALSPEVSPAEEPGEPG